MNYGERFSAEMTQGEIIKRLDKLYDLMDGRRVRCKVWNDPNDQWFNQEQIHGTFDLMIMFDGEKRAFAMRCANDLWKTLRERNEC